MKSLWICDVVLPEFCKEYNIKKNVTGGWMTGMFHKFQTQSEYEIGFCFPIIDKNRLRDGITNGYRYYSYNANSSDINMDIRRFQEIFEEFNPDIIHLWGTEYPRFWAAIRAGELLSIENRFIVHIQGLVSICSFHYDGGLLEDIVQKKVDGYPTIEEGRDDFIHRGEFEKSVLRHAKYILGRTEWDRACVKMISPNSKYYYCSEILRDSFYFSKYKWDFSKCEKHSIFVSQAYYPLKGFHKLVEGLSILKDKYNDIKLYVAGDDYFIKDNEVGKKSPYGNYISQLIEKYGLQNNIFFLGRIQEKDMVEYYLKANVFVMCSAIENSSNSVAEAMILGTPVIASYVGGNPDLIKHGENGYLYPYDEYYMLAYHIDKCFENPGELEKISKAAILSAKDRYDPDKVLNQLLHVYDEIVGKNS